MKQNSENPFFGTYRTPFETPPFDRIETEHYEPAFDEGIQQLDEEVQAIANNTELPTFENTIVALERSGKLLDKVSSTFFNVLNAEADDEMMNISQRVSPKLSESSNNIYLNEKLFARVKSVYEQIEKLRLPTEDTRLLEKTFEAFCVRGAALGPEEKEKYRKLSSELSLLSLTFDQNALKDKNRYELLLTKEDVCLLSDAAVMSVWPTMKPYLTAGKALYFSHGFAITWNDRTGVVPPADIDVIMVAPKGSGTSLRSMFLEGRGLNSSFAIYQDATGKAMDRTLALGIGIGSGYLFETTFIREATSDLTGERGSLMGAIQGLLLAQYEVLRENGHTPSEAFNETVEELTQSLMPLFAKNGMDWMYANCSTTAQRGALDWMGPFHDAIKPVVEKLYANVKCGNEAQISIDSNSKPDYREKLEAELKALRESEMWQTAVTVRKLRPENN